MSNIIPFRFEENQVRAISDEQSDPWFVLRDILDAMQSKTKTTGAVVSIEQGLGKGFVNDIPLETRGGMQTMTIIAEAAATYLLSRSNTETGRKLNRFVHAEVLPTLRKTGRYAVPSAASLIPSGTRFLAMHTGTRWVLTEVPKDAYVFSAEEMPRLVTDPDYPRAQLPNLLKAVAERMAA